MNEELIIKNIQQRMFNSNSDSNQKGVRTPGAPKRFFNSS